MLPKLDPIGLAGIYKYLVSLLYLENNQATYTSHFKSGRKDRVDISNHISFFRSSILTNVEIEVVESGRSTKTRSSIAIPPYVNVN